MRHLGFGQGFHRLNEIVAYRLGKGVFETYRCKPFGLAELSRWIHREERCDVSVVPVFGPGQRPKRKR